MGYAIVHGYCASCRSLFSFNPNKVPSVRVNGTRKPICEVCVKTANPLRIAKGLPEIPILPGAYEPCREEEL